MNPAPPPLPSWFRRVIARGLPAVLVAGALLFPLVQVVHRGITLTGQYEEPLGYRYFYTLRQVYDTDPYVYLPQGHLMDIHHQLIQMGLTAAGCAPDTVQPRIDLFSYLSVALAHGFAAFAFVYAFWRASNGLRWTAVPVVLLAYSTPSIYGFNVVLEPDYASWLLPIALLFTGLALRLLQAAEPTQPLATREAVLLGMFATLAVGIKITLVVYPLALGLALLVGRPRPLHSLIRLAGAAAICGAGFLFILWAYYRGEPSYVIRFFHDQAAFGGAVQSSQPYVAWLKSVLRHAPWLVRAAVALPAVLVCVALLCRDRRRLGIALGLGGGAAAYHFFLYVRYQPITWFEAATFLLFALIVAATTCLPASWKWIRIGLATAACAGASLQFAAGLGYIEKSYLVYLTFLNRGQTAAAASLASANDRIAFLIPDNSFRPLTIDAAIWKGGSNILGGNLFCVSPLVRRLFPHREYLSRSANDYAANPPDLKPFPVVVFVVRKGLDPTPFKLLQRMQAYYNVSLAHLRLDTTVDLGCQEFLVWTNSPAAAAADVPNIHPPKASITVRKSAPTYLDVEWPPDHEASSYELEMATGSEGDFSYLGRGIPASGRYVQGGLAPGTIYRFRLYRVVAGVESEPSEIVSASPE